MTSGRICLLTVCLVGIALATVNLRVERTRSAARLLKAEANWFELRRQWWTLQTRRARLRAPQRIHERIGALDLELIPPGVDLSLNNSVRLASDHFRGH